MICELRWQSLGILLKHFVLIEHEVEIALHRKCIVVFIEAKQA